MYSTLVLTLLGVGFLFFWLPPHQDELTQLAIDHPIVAPLIIIFFRMIGMVIPPIPGGVISFALIPVLGWFWSSVYSMIGLTLGAIIAFFIARKFREPVIARFVPLQDLNKWEDKLSGKTEFFAFLGIRMMTGPIMDFISYVAGLSKISFWKFLLATVIAEIPSVFAYYVGGEVYKKVSVDNGAYVGVGILLAIGVAFFYLKDHEIIKRYTKKKDKTV